MLNETFSILEQAQTVLVMLSVLILAYVLMLLSGLITRFIGTSGASVVSRVMGLILSAVATTNILTGIGEYYKFFQP